jgi:aminopeptidase 2
MYALSITFTIVHLISYVDLVWSAIADNLSALTSAWWEYPEIQKNLNAFKRVSSLHLIWTRMITYWMSLQSLFVPIVKKLGYDRKQTDTTDEVQLRAVAIEQAASGEDEELAPNQSDSALALRSHF